MRNVGFTNSACLAFSVIIFFACTKQPIVPKIPTLITTNANSITPASANTGGNITSDGGAAVTQRGVCFNKASSPTIADSVTNDGAGMGTFTSRLSVLSSNTKYFVRAFATNKAGTAYGNEISFTTLLIKTIPQISTLSILAITDSSAEVASSILSDGGAPITKRGVYWSNTSTTYDSMTNNGTGPGNFTANLLRLKASTTYYVRAYATNSVGTGFGQVLQFTTQALPDSLSVQMGLVAYYPFSGNAADSSGNGNDGMVNGATLAADRFGRPNSAYNFDGTNSIVAPSQNWINFGMPATFTINAWINLTGIQPSAHNGIVSMGNANGYNYQLGVDSLMAVGEIGIPAIKLANILSTQNLQPGTWNFVSMVVSMRPVTGRTLPLANGYLTRVALYFNGSIVAFNNSIMPAEKIVSPDPLRIGVDANLLNFFNGKIDDVRIYNRALSSSEITYLSNH